MSEIRIAGDQFTLVLVDAPKALIDRAQERARKVPGFDQPCGMDVYHAMEFCREKGLPLPSVVVERFQKCYGEGVYARRIGEWRLVWQ